MLHPVLAAYHLAMAGWVSEEELGAIDLSGTLRGDPQRLRYIAADHTIRRLLPLALEAQRDAGCDLWAAELRALPPLLNRDTDLVAQPVVAGAMRALRRKQAGYSVHPPMPPQPATEAAGTGAAGFPGSAGSPGSAELLRVPATAPLVLEEQDPLDLATQMVDPEVRAAYVEALAEYSDAYAEAFGVSPAHADAAAAAAADAVAAGFLVRTAVEEYGVRREDAVEELRGAVEHMADAARRRERMPTPTPRREREDDPMTLHGGAAVP